MTKAIILVAGMGTRLQPRTLHTHKCLTKICGVPILKNALDNLSSCGIHEVVLVVGYLKEEIVKEIKSFDLEDIDITFAENNRYADTNTTYSLKIGLESLGDYSEAIVIEGDVFFDGSILNQLLAHNQQNVTVLERYHSGLEGTFVSLDADSYITDWRHKSEQGEDYNIEDKYKTVNIHRFSYDFIETKLKPYIFKSVNNMSGREPLEYVMRRIVNDDKSAISGMVLDGEMWFEIDTEEDLKTAEAYIEGNMRGRV